MTGPRRPSRAPAASGRSTVSRRISTRSAPRRRRDGWDFGHRAAGDGDAHTRRLAIKTKRPPQPKLRRPLNACPRACWLAVCPLSRAAPPPIGHRPGGRAMERVNRWRKVRNDSTFVLDLQAVALYNGSRRLNVDDACRRQARPAAASALSSVKTDKLELLRQRSPVRAGCLRTAPRSCP